MSWDCSSGTALPGGTSPEPHTHTQLQGNFLGKRGENVFSFTPHPEQNSATHSCSTTEGTGNWVYSTHCTQKFMPQTISQSNNSCFQSVSVQNHTMQVCPVGFNLLGLKHTQVQPGAAQAAWHPLFKGSRCLFPL